MPRSAVIDRPNAGADTKSLPTGLIIVVLALCGTLVSLQQTLVLPLLPDFPEILDTTSDNASWLVTITLLTGAVGTPIVSRLADMFGKRLMLLLCLVSVIIGSVLGALSDSLFLVIVARGLTGIGTCLVPVGISIMRDHLPAERVGSGVALMSATLGIGGAVGMPLAGVIYQNFDWQMLFVVSGGFAVLMLGLVWAVVPESTVRTLGRFDYPGALLLSIALTSFLLAVSKAGSWGWTDRKTITLILLALLVLTAWIPLELRLGQPLVDIRTSMRRTVLLTNVASILIGFAMFTNFLTSAQQVQMPVETGYGFGLSVIDTGLVMLPAGILMVAMAPVAAWLIRVYGPRAVIIGGAVVIAVGFVLRAFLHNSVLEVMIASGISSLGTALAFAAMPTLIMRAVPITETASANGLNTLLRAIGTSTASAVVAAVFAAMAVDGMPNVPRFAAYQLVFWLGAGAALLGAFIAAFIARPRPVAQSSRAAGEVQRSERHDVKQPEAENEVVVGGLITDDHDRPIKQAVVTVLHPDGRHVDWGRTDNSGRYVLALPEVGRYLVVVSADGWGPMSGLENLGDSDLDQIRMNRRLRLTGHVTDSGEPLPAVMISLIRHSGEYVATGHADDTGGYELHLPPPGRYVLTVVDHPTGRTRSRAVQVGSTSATLDIDIVTGIPPHRSRPVEETAVR
ncbi:MFS transporter [Ornithinimicrobium cryptoxanthini]|uniref:MFS transporter n=1 Tax=Ornithinimicrobium cryptoxanthini TaxID=2934161 RepID=A0ABY4YE37_9MICO|nr:MFS transporter [Ornithinimicrobium cryptoxanthini]USQ74820.1 MFS transporter [Ornithinimicrobium cryptoxanthini]